MGLVRSFVFDFEAGEGDLGAGVIWGSVAH